MSPTKPTASSIVGTAGPAVLSISGLDVSFHGPAGWTRVVNGISFDVKPQETLAIVGESGSGKSVTAMSVMRLLPPSTSRIEGRVLLDGQDVTTLPETAMQAVRGDRIAMIFQEPMTSLNPVLTVGLQIAESLVRHRGLGWTEARREALRLLERVRVPSAASRMNDYPHKLSGGMRQRVMIAMALACRPRILIADEPTTALDVTIQAEILELIKMLQSEEGMSVLFITHDMGVVAEVADRTLVMRRGDIVESGETPQIFASPVHPYTRALLAAVPRLGDMAGMPGPVPFSAGAEVLRHAEQSAPKCELASRPKVLEVTELTARFDIRKGWLGRVSSRVHAVENLSFSLSAGETLSLVGESGCGKSTTGRCIVGLVKPSAGSILLDGEDVTRMSRQELMQARRKVQMIFQDPFASLNPRIPVGKAIAAPLLAHGLATASEARDIVAELLTRVGLDPAMASRLPREFSGGQRQRICIARALALRPKVIVADEAVSALDVSIKAQVIDLMMELQEQFDLAFLFISHDMAIVERVSHRVAVMYLGEIVEIGQREAVFGNPQHPYTRKLLSAVPVPDPSRRRARRGLSAEEIPSPIRPVEYVAPPRRFREISPGHLIQV